MSGRAARAPGRPPRLILRSSSAPPGSARGRAPADDLPTRRARVKACPAPGCAPGTGNGGAELAPARGRRRGADFDDSTIEVGGDWERDWREWEHGCSDWERDWGDWERDWDVFQKATGIHTRATRTTGGDSRNRLGARGGNSPGRLGHQGGDSLAPLGPSPLARRPRRSRLAPATCARRVRLALAPLPRAPPLPRRSLPRPESYGRPGEC